MQIIFKKKNANTTDRTFYIDEGSTITENYNETLDSAIIRISHLTSQLDIEPFDKVILRDENENLDDRYMCVDSYTETMESLDPYIYSYQISLFSETKELEGILLPNLCITKGSTPRLISHYLNQYLKLYGPKIRVNGQLQAKYTFSLKVYSKCAVECPEMQWNNPTLREVLTSLMMVVDCIPVVRNNVIDCIDLTEKKSAIDTSKVNYIQRSQSSEDYVSELKMDMLNVTQTSVDGVKQTVNRMEHLTFRAESDSYVVTDTNLVLKTQYPILNVKHLWMTFQAFVEALSSGTGRSALRTFKIDLCGFRTASNSLIKLLYEKTEFNVLPIASINPGDFSTLYQNMCVYFTRYSNEISGFSQLTREGWVFNNKIGTLRIIKENVSYYCYDMNGERPSLPYVDNDQFKKDNVYFSTFFEIEYETTADAVFKAGKSIAPTHERVVTDNQTYAFVDAYNQGFMEYQKVNRLGNHQLYINARYEDDYADAIKIGDYYGDSIVYQTTYQIYKNHIEVNAVATKDYILRDYFTGVKARIRSWKIADASQALTRHDLEKCYLEFSKSSKTEYFTPDRNIPQYFLSPLMASYIRPLRYAFVTTDNYPEDSNYCYTLDLLGRIMGNSIVFTFGFDDNFAVGKRVSSNLQSSNIDANKWQTGQQILVHIRKDFTDDYGGIPLEDLKYVDANGEMINLNYNLTYDIDDPDALHNYYEKFNNANDSSKFFLFRVCKLPEIQKSLTTSYVKLSGTREIDKDNKEVPKLSLQFEFCSDTHDIVFTKKFLELQECIRELKSSEQQISHESKTVVLNYSNFVQSGGSLSVTATSGAPWSYQLEPDACGGSYTIKIQELYGKTLSAGPTITNTSTVNSNTVTFNNNVVDPALGNIGTFTGTIWNDGRTAIATQATISYTVQGEETPVWVASQAFNFSSLAGQRVTNISATGFTPGVNDEFYVTFNQATGTFTVYIKTYTQPAATTSITISYDLVLQDGTYVANTVKVYKGSASNFNWKNPSLTDTELIVGGSVTFNHALRTSTIYISGATDVSTSAFYITDASNNILLAVNKMSYFYLNVLLSRDYNIYDSNGDVVGSI